MTAEWADTSDFNALGKGRFPEHCDLRFVEWGDGFVHAEVDLGAHHLAPNGYLHAGLVVTLADTACGYGVRTCAPDDSSGFTTAELKANFLGTALEGTISCVAVAIHRGRTTQVWDATVTQDERKLALLRCTQLILYPR